MKQRMKEWWKFWSQVWLEFWPCKKMPHYKKTRIVQLLLLVLLGLGSWFGFRASRLVMGILDPTRLKIFAVMFGLEITLMLGLLSRWLLETYVTVEHPRELRQINFERNSGGPFLGFLERIIFFASLYRADYFVGGAWIAFKLGAKWQVWQQIIKVPDKIHDDMETNLRVKEQLGSRVLGRFLNGTLWNLICGLIGAAVTKSLLLFPNLARDISNMIFEILVALNLVN